MAFGCDAHKVSNVNSNDTTTVAKSAAQSIPTATRPASSAPRKSKFPPRLSDFGLFQEPMSDLRPVEGVIEYELNTPLFSDYSRKQRLIRLPPGSSASYRSAGPLDFPVGTVIAKTFYYDRDTNDPTAGRQLVETRIMEHRKDGWIGIPYLWNDDQSEALLAIAGATVPVSWNRSDGDRQSNSHVVPNVNDCKRCHTNAIMEPIGPKANNLNRNIRYEHDRENQLDHWTELGMLSGAPSSEVIPQLASWDDEATGTVQQRARAYLEVNCAHCHNPAGPARNSGLHLNVENTAPYRLGVFKTPVAAGKGTGGRLYGIVPGKPDESILEYRMQTVAAGEVMPEFGKSLVHHEGLALIRQWITEMKDASP